jgi:hypothetical protein
VKKSCVLGKYLLKKTIAHLSMPVRQFLLNLQMRGAFIAAFTFFTALAIDNQFFVAHF